MPSLTKAKLQSGCLVVPCGCWEWQQKRDRHGYGHIHLGGRHRLAHRIAYEVFVGAIPEGFQIDHLCRNRCCINPDHLEAVPPIVNWARGISFSVQNALKTICPVGHALAGSNLYLLPNGHRGCRQCRKDAATRYQQRKRAA